MKWNRKKVLVTGGASFIGSQLVEQLVELKADVTVADDLSSGKKENLNSVLPEITLKIGNLRMPSFASSVMKGNDVVFHLAASHGGRGYIATHPADCSSNMVLDGIVFSAAMKAGVEKVCFASSACVYPTVLQQSGANKPIYLSEEMANPFEFGRAFADEEYGWAKLMGEMSLKAYNKQHGLKGVSGRIFTAYGPRENESHAVIALVAKAFVGMDPYEIWGSGEQDRNFTYVTDISSGLIHAAENIDDCSPINIGRAEHIKINDVVEEIFKVTGFRPKKIVRDTSKPEGVFTRAADLSRTRKRLGWIPSTSFEKGLRKTIEWYYKTHDKKTVRKDLDRLLTER